MWAPSMLLACSWIPWVFWAAYRLWNGEKNSFLFLSLAFALQMSSGYPVFFYLTLLTLGLDWFLKILLEKKPKSEWREWTAKTGFVISAILLAFLFNAAWFFPFKEFIGYSNLNGRLGLTESLKWDDLVTWLNPFFKGHPLHSHPESPSSVTVFFDGLPVLVAIFWGFRSRKFARISAVLFLLVLVLSL